MEVLTQMSADEEEEEIESDVANVAALVSPPRAYGQRSASNRDYEDDDGGGEYVFTVEIDGSPSKRRKCTSISAVSNNFDVFLFSEALQGGVEALYCERFNGDSSSQLTRVRTMLDEEHPGLMALGIRAVAERAEKHANGEPIALKNIETYEGRTYNKLVLLRMVDSTSKKSRREALVRLASIVNSQTDILIKNKELKANQPKWRVRKTFDRTPVDPKNFRKLDELVTPVYAVKIVTEAYTTVGPSWGIDNPELAKLFFSPPYAKVTRDSLFRGSG